MAKRLSVCLRTKWLWVRISMLSIINVKVFNLMSRTNETRHIKFHETCKCKCILDASVSNNNNAGIKISVDANVKD